ncbi:hypothetical protein U0070_017331 [Myodes glareolus]|uniref:Uncharacterized protein n=1 Tax=Myodes glareolus TaxID=447135 RepID=A0AAW0K2W9_MYOGA
MWVQNSHYLGGEQEGSAGDYEDHIELVVFLHALCYKMGTSYCIIKEALVVVVALKKQIHKELPHTERLRLDCIPMSLENKSEGATGTGGGRRQAGPEGAERSPEFCKNGHRKEVM